MTFFSFSRMVDPAIAGLKEGKEMPRESFLTLSPDSDRNERVSTKTPSNLSSQKFARSPPWFHRFFSGSHDAMIRVYDLAGNVIEAHEHAGEFKEW